MPTLRQAAAATTDLTCRTVGRSNVVRAARFVLNRARLDIPNDPHTNGEESMQQWILKLSQDAPSITIIDVGANIGQWSQAMLGAAQLSGRLDDLSLHAFEPSSYTFSLLSEALHGQPATLQRLALSDQSGSAALHVAAPGAGRNSLHTPITPHAPKATEDVATTTLDAYTCNAGLDHITFIKIDTEGHDLAVLRGARRLFAQQRVLAAQFEYNCRWIAARSFLRDAFDFLAPFGYRLGKLTPHGVEFYPAWDAELETFVEGNYIASLPWVSDRLPAVPWWKSHGWRTPQ